MFRNEVCETEATGPKPRLMSGVAVNHLEISMHFVYAPLDILIFYISGVAVIVCETGAVGSSHV